MVNGHQSWQRGPKQVAFETDQMNCSLSPILSVATWMIHTTIRELQQNWLRREHGNTRTAGCPRMSCHMHVSEVGALKKKEDTLGRDSHLYQIVPLKMFLICCF